MGDDLVKISWRVRWVVDSDREDIAEAGRLSYRGDEQAITDPEGSSLAERILKNLALIRTYEARRDD
ncbi:hypothetical protein [Bradyrhizobium sp. ARR65]|uniref:hypothetical protein n=1 Tax=Bradyrhizobium sp. ARR65 TaxID=1040989 RepID=UPI0012FA5B2B|nr:hypothetical protein [Bradyrhizobium sp. ARR65]